MEIIDQNTNSSRFNDPERLSREGYSFNLGNYINFAFSCIQKDPIKFFAYGFLSTVIASVPFLAYPAYAGFFVVADKIKKGELYTFDDFFGGFRDRLGPLILASIVGGVLMFVGFMLCVIPGIYLAVAWSFSIPFIVFYTGDFWQAMEMSRKVITRSWFSFLLLAIIGGLLASLGILICFIGVFLTLPILYLSIYAAYEDIVGTGKPAA